MEKSTITVNGKTYGLSAVHITETKAQQQARRFRNRGFNAVVKKSTHNGKTVYNMYSTIGDTMKEVLYDGVVHYRRPANHPDIEEVERYIENHDTLYEIRDA